MKIQAYIRVCGRESVVREIHEETNLPSANLKQLKAKMSSGDEYCWNWQTEMVSVDVDDVDGSLKEFLTSHRQLFPTIKNRNSEADIHLEIVTRYEDGDDLRGFYLSAETIALLGELGGAVDNDVEAYGLSLRKT